MKLLVPIVLPVGAYGAPASPRGIYQAADGGWLSIAASNQGIAKRLFAAMGRSDLLDDDRFATNPARLMNNDAIQQIVQDWVASMPRDEVLATLDKHEVVCAAVNDARDIVADPHFRERTLVELTGCDVLGRVLMPGPVLHLRDYPGPSYHGVPAVGEHSRAVLVDGIGVPEAEFTRLIADGVVTQA